MPLQIIISEELVSIENAQKMHNGITAAFLKVHNLSGNEFMTPNAIGEVTLVPKGLSFSGGGASEIAIVELKTPSFCFESTEQKELFIDEATQIVFDNCNGKLPKSNIWVNLVFAVDGMWGIGGKAYSNDDLGNAINGSHSAAVA